jgi:hypothetical protein
MQNHSNQLLRLHFLSDLSEGIPVPSPIEVVNRLLASPEWDEASIIPIVEQLPRLALSRHGDNGIVVHCIDDEDPHGFFLASALKLSEPALEIDHGGQATEKWPREMFVSASLAVSALEHFVLHRVKSGSLIWIAATALPRVTVWELNA